MLSLPLPGTRGCFKVVSAVRCRIRHTARGEAFCLLNKQSVSSGLDLLCQKTENGHPVQYTSRLPYNHSFPQGFFFPCFFFFFSFLKKGIDFFYPRSSDKGRSRDVYCQVKYKVMEVQGDLIPQPYCQVENK